MTKQEPALGALLTEDADRDALHIAIVPIIAPEHLAPSQPVDQFGNPNGKPVGIVDPFLKDIIPPGARFYLCLYPGTVTGMTHTWRHPSFQDVLKGERGNDLPPGDTARAESEQWLRDYAAQVSHYDDPETAYDNLLAGLLTGKLHYHGSDLHSYEEVQEPRALQHHASLLLGRPIYLPDFRFSCSC